MAGGRQGHCQDRRNQPGLLEKFVTETSPASVKLTRHIGEFDGLRGILALWVAVSHIFCWCGFVILPFHLPGTIERLWGEFVFAQGAVDVFIILSGFVISYLLNSRRQSYGRFMGGRFFRIYPVYLFCLLVSFTTIFLIPFILNQAVWRNTIYFQWEQSYSTSELASPLKYLLAHLTLLFGMIPERILPQSTTTLLPPAWSITLEWQYYLVAPLIAFAIRSTTGILVLGLIGCGGFYYSHYWDNGFLLNKLPLFLVGIGCFQLYSTHSRWKDSRHITFIILALWAGAMLISWHWIALGIWIPVFGCLFVNQDDLYSRSLHCLRKILLHPILQFIGKISYPLYLIHWPVIILLMFGILHWHPEISATQTMLLMFCPGLPIILFIAFFLHTFIEVPFMKFGKSLLRS
jgi:peptidoglycan/LPS O-acetylase OafA/YrhL